MYAINDNSISYLVDEHNSAFITLGAVFDSIGCQAIYTAIHDEKGQLKNYSTFCDTTLGFTYLLNLPHNFEISNGNVLTGLVNIATENAHFFNHNLESGDWTTKEITSELNPKSRTIGFDFDNLNSNKTIVALSKLQNNELKPLFILKDSFNFRELEYEEFNDVEVPLNVCTTSDTTFMALLHGEGTNRILFLQEYDINGNILWSYTFQGQKVNIGELISIGENRAVVSTADFRDESGELRPRIFLIDKTEGIIWNYYPGGNFWEDSVAGYFPSGVTSNEKDGYVFCGSRELSFSPDSSAILPVVFKISNEGEELWYRSFRVVGVNGDIVLNSFTDIVNLAEGGYVINGNILYRSKETSLPVNAGLLLKITNNGHVTTSNESPIEHASKNDIVVYPNPTNELLFISQKENKNIKYELHGPDGSKILSFNGSVKNEIQILSITDLPSGIYYLFGYHNSNQVYSHKVIKY